MPIFFPIAIAYREKQKDSDTSAKMRKSHFAMDVCYNEFSEVHLSRIQLTHSYIHAGRISPYSFIRIVCGEVVGGV